MDQFNWHLGKVLLSNFTDSTAIAIYSIGVQIDILFIGFGVAFSGVVVPKIYQLVREHARQELSELWLRVGRYQFYVVYFIWLGFLLFGESFILLWAGETYRDAYIVALLLMMPLPIHLCQTLAIEILRAYNRHRLWTLVHLAGSIIGFLICIPLTKEYGVLGVSAGTSITSLIILNFYDNWYYAKHGQLNVLFFFRGMAKLLPAALLCALAGTVINELFSINAWLDFLIVAVAYILAYIVIMYLIALNEHEKLLVKKIILRTKAEM